MADFPNIPIDVTAKEIEQKVKETIETTVKKDSSNPVSSGAVFEALENVEVGTDNILDGSISDPKLQDTYIKLGDAIIRSYSDLDNLIEIEDAERYKHSVVVSGLAPFHDVIGEGFLSATAKDNALELVNHKTGKSWYYEKGSNSLIETLKNKMGTADTFQRVELLGDTANPEILARQTSDPTSKEMLRIPLSEITKKTESFVTVEIESLVEYVTEELDKKADKTDVAVDLEYNPESPNAQSGSAVAEAVGGRVKTELTYLPRDSVDLLNYGLNNFALYSYQTSNKLPVKVTLDDIKSVIVGDIETALDDILAIQESYIGGGVE